jgi:hypothetical protein
MDVPVDAWFQPYVAASLDAKIIPIAGFDATRFYPDWAVLRGEAAALIWNAQHPESASSEMASSSSVTSVTSRSRTSQSSSEGQTATQVDFPFNDDGKFASKSPKLYDFSFTTNHTIDIDVTFDTEGSVQCRLFKLIEDGISYEYYLGHISGDTCHLRVALGAGAYQLEVIPDRANVSYTVVTNNVSGDGNDGFVEASLLLLNKSRGSQLAVADVADWYKFTVTEKTTLTLTTYGDGVTCLIYPLADVDIFGFAGPKCGEAYEYPKGSYIVGVTRAINQDKALTYSIEYH